MYFNSTRYLVCEGAARNGFLLQKIYQSRNFRLSRSFSTAIEQKVYKKSEFATEWQDEKFPEYQQFLELNTKRKYYHNRESGEVSWSPPGDPDFDLFAHEKKEADKEITLTPLHADHIKPASMIRRIGAVSVDILTSSMAGAAFAGFVFLDLGDVYSAAASAGFATWAAFLFRDVIFEEGTRSIGKKMLKLEIVKDDGRLPSRYNNFFRNIYLLGYAGSVQFMPFILALPLSEFGILLFGKNGKRIGDWIANTVVIEEQVNREERVQEKKNADAAENLRE
eukprot:snap_masked-scaffold_53-processed-gene-1.84-mRNA-1 protein AED:0.04 eAED:0.04 QI:0/-1/0/1/-1/1/1/0/279